MNLIIQYGLLGLALGLGLGFILYAVAIGPVTGPLARWLLVRQLVTCKASANQIHAFTSCEYIRHV